MKSSHRLFQWILIFIFLLGSLAVPRETVQAAGGINLTAIGTTYAQDFNTLANAGTTNDIDDLNNGWYLTETGGSGRDNELYGADDGGDNTGDTISYGTTGGTERALGGLQTGTLVPLFGARFTNGTGTAINALSITYTGEEWRLGNAARTDQLTFEYSLNATSLTTGTWTGVAGLDFITPDTVTAGAKNGNAAGECTTLSALISGLAIPNGGMFWIRWTDVNVGGADDGLAVDDFSLTPLASSIVTNVSSSTANGAYTTGAVIPITVTFSTLVNVTGTPRLTLETGTTDRVVSYSSGTGTATLTFNYTVQAGDTSPDLDYAATTSLTLNGGTIRDAAGNDAILTLPAPGNPGSLGANKAIVIDTTAPTVAMSSAAPNPTSTSPIPVTVQFSEAVIGFTAGDILPTNGTVNNFVAVAGDTYTFDLAPAGQGMVTADIAAGVAVDAAGNGSAAAVQFSRTYDSAAPTVAMSSAAPNPTSTSPIPVTVQFSEPVTGFVAGDITPTNGTVNNFVAVAGDTYTFDLTPSGQGLVAANIADGVAMDAAGNGNTAAVQFSRTYDSIGPTVMIDQAAGQTDPTNVSPVDFAVQFTENVADFAAGDVTLGGTAGATTVNITGGPANYNVAASGMTAPGTVIITIAAGATHDAAGNGNTDSNNIDNTVTFIFNTGTTLISSNNPAIVGQTVTFTATVTSLGSTPTGNVEFREGAVVLGTGALNAGGQATFSTNTLALGTHNITAYYLGAAGYNASNSALVAQVIGLANTTTALVTSGSPSGFGAPVTFTATVTVVAPGTGTPTGNVEFFDGAASLGTGALGGGGQATLTTSSLTTGTHTITAVYAGDPNFNGSTSSGLTQDVNGPPAVTRINSSADTGDGQVVENEHTSVAITQLLVAFSKDMNADTPGDLDDALNPTNYSLVQGVSTAIPIAVTYDAGTHTVTLGVAALPNGAYTLTVLGRIEDTLGAPIGTDFVRHFVVDSGDPYHTSIVTVQNNATITNGATLNVRFSSVNITFNENLGNAGGGTGADDVTYPHNYLLLQTGPNGAYDTYDCRAFATNANTPLGDDIRIPTGSVTYTHNGGSGPFVATVPLNNGTALPNGAYRLLICGTTSIVDLAGNPLNGGTDSQVNFNVLVLNSVKHNPRTGFAPGVVTLLPEQPADKAYTSLGNLWIEIPRLSLKTSITGVPLQADGWDLTWLNGQVGWLEGTAYPTWEGNTALTAHGYTADGKAGPFALLKNLSYGDTVIIHFSGRKYTYSVRTNLLTNPNDTHWLTKHETLDWITLITCQQYEDKTQSYRYRRVVRAVLVSAEQE